MATDTVLVNVKGRVFLGAPGRDYHVMWDGKPNVPTSFKDILSADFR